MSLLWFDGFENYTAGNTGRSEMNSIKDYRYYTTADNSNYPLVAAARTGGMGFQLYNSNQYTDIKLLGHSSNAYIYIGFAYQFANASHTPASATNNPFLELRDDAGGNRHLHFNLNSSFNWEVKNNANTILGTGEATLVRQTWYHIQMGVYFHDSAGTITLKVNGVDDITETSEDTINGSNGYCGGLRLRQMSTNEGTLNYIDDLWICDGAGGAPHNTFLGDCRIDAITVDGAGSTTQFTPSAGSNYQNVDEGPGPDEDTTYNDGEYGSGSPSGETDLYALSSLASPPSNATIYGVKNQSRIRKTDSGTRKAAVVVRSGGTDYSGESETLSDSYITYTEIYEDNPADASAWEDADINALEAGVVVME